MDGYNVIFSWDDLKLMAKNDLQGARDSLLEILCNFQGVTRSRVIVVFDAYRVKNNPGRQEKYKNITVVYTSESETADHFIEKYTFNFKHPYRARVVTSDGLEQVITMGHGALRTSSREFRKEVEAANVEIRKVIERSRVKGGGQNLAVALGDALEKRFGGNQ